MSDERRFDDHEVQEILRLAIGREDAAESPAPSAREGLTLRELQAAGREVGVSADAIAHAVTIHAARGEIVPRTTALGLPTSVGRVVPLPRDLTDREWERLVAELRLTFDGAGVVSAQGSLRQWSNGSVSVFVEPTATGHRLRLTDSRAAVLGVGLVASAFLVGFGALITAVLFSKGDPGIKLLVPSLFALSGGAVAALCSLPLPKWARLQEERMERISTFTAGLLVDPTKTQD